MNKRIHRWLRLSLLVTLTIFLIGACSGNVSNNSPSSNSSPVATRIVKHALGKVKVPANPERLITPSPCTMEPALALGVKPVGGSHWNWDQPYLQGRTDGIEDVGWIPEVNLELIATLQPDLIVGTIYQQDIYHLLSQIAPTFLAEENPKGSGDWKKIFAQVAEALGKTETAEQVMSDYYARLNKFKAQMGEQLQDLKVSVVAVYLQSVNSYLKSDFSGTILEDAGLSRPPLQNQDRAAVLAGGTNISKERLHDIDGDIMFLIVNTGKDQQTQKTLQQLKADPLWSQLSVVQKEKVFEVGDYWLSCSPLAANAVIDDLFKYLVNTS